MWRGRAGLLWGLLLGLTATASRAQTPDAPEIPEAERPSAPELLPEPRPPFKLLPAAVSVVPGVLLHGLGSLVGGEYLLARRLFILESAGLGLLLVGGVPITLTGASRHVIGPLYAVALTGTGVFSISMMSNLYAAVSPLVPRGAPARRLPRLEVELGYQHVTDPVFAYRHFVSAGVRARLSRLRLEAGVQGAPSEGNLRTRVGGAWRLIGAPEGERLGARGSALDVEAAMVIHRFPAETFTLGGGEFFFRGRKDLAILGPRLEGAFAELGVGMSAQHYAYRDVEDDRLSQQLLYTFGFGVYLGQGGPFRGEALLYYDHRKDDFAGALRGGAGVPGFLGVKGRALIAGPWGVSAEFQMGSALVGRLALIYAWGGDS